MTTLIGDEDFLQALEISQVLSQELFTPPGTDCLTEKYEKKNG